MRYLPIIIAILWSINRMLGMVSVLVATLTVPWQGSFDIAHISLIIAVCSLGLNWLRELLIERERNGRDTTIIADGVGEGYS